MSMSAFSTWTQEHLRGAQRLAQQDAETMERLSRLLRAKHSAVTDSEETTCEGCECPLPPTNRSGFCKACLNREWMRNNRKGRTDEQKARKNELRRERRHAEALRLAEMGDDHRLRTIQGMARRQESP